MNTRRSYVPAVPEPLLFVAWLVLISLCGAFLGFTAWALSWLVAVVKAAL